MVFSDDIKGDSKEFIDGFGEDVTYIPHSEMAIYIQAVIERNPPSEVIEHGGQVFSGNRIELWIANNESIGITKVKERFDKVKLPKRLDEDMELVEYRITKIIDHDAGMWHLEAQA